MTLYRPHRGLLDESMAEVCTVNNQQELISAMMRGLDWYPKDKRPTPDNITIEKYGPAIDKRTGWDTHIVCVNGSAWGFTDGPLP